MKRIDIIKKLISEGFNEKTLMSLPDKQLNVLAKRMLGEGRVHLSKNSPSFKQDQIDLEKNNTTYETYEQEIPDGSSKSPIEESLDLYRQLYEGMDTLSYEEKRDLNMRIMDIRTKLTPEQDQEFKNGRDSINANEINGKEEQTEGEVETKEAARTFAMGRRGLLAKKVAYAGKDCQLPYEEKKKRKKTNKKKRKSTRKSNRSQKNESKTSKLLETYTKVKESGQLKEWVTDLVDGIYHPTATKNEILEMVKVKLQEQELNSMDTEKSKNIWTQKLQTIFNRLYNAKLPVDGNWNNETYNQYKKKYYEDNDIYVHICKEGDSLGNPGEITTRGKDEVRKLNMIVDKDFRNNETKLQEQEPTIAPSKPKTKPTTKPDRESTPEKTPYPNPWQPPDPNKLPDPTPKFGTEKLPDWLEFDNIIKVVKGDEIEDATSNILQKIHEQAFNDAGEPLMTDKQYRDYSEPSEPEYDDREPDHFDDSPGGYLEHELEGHDILLEPGIENEYSIPNTANVDFMVWINRGKIHIDIGNTVETNQQVFDDEEKALRYILKYKKIFLSIDDAEKKKSDDLDAHIKSSQYDY